MLIINGVEFNSGDFSPEHSADKNNSIMENKKIASDNIKVNPLSGSVNLSYTNKSETDDYRDKKIFLEDLLYDRDIFDVFDTVENIVYENMCMIKVGSFSFYKNGFNCSIGLEYANVTETAVPGQEQYKGQQTRSIRYKEKPLKQISAEGQFLSEDTKQQLEEMGITEEDGFYNVNALDVDSESIGNGLSENILTSIGGNRLNFDILPDGTLDILDGAGNYLVGGQKVLANVEFLANLIPGVDYTMKLLPFSQDAVNKVFDISRLGTDWQIVTNQISEGVDSLGT